MKIASPELRNFLSIDHLDLIELDPTLCVLVGPNGAGNSSLLRAVEMVRDALRAYDSDFRIRASKSAPASCSTARLEQIGEGLGRRRIVDALQGERGFISAWCLDFYGKAGV